MFIFFLIFFFLNNYKINYIFIDEVDYILGDDFRLDAKHLNRVHEELEKLNIATDVINKLELQLDEARATFRYV